MAATDMEIEQNAGTPEQLPQGEASALNEALPTTKTPTEPESLVEEVPIEYAQPSDYEPTYAPEDEDMSFVTGPTTRPDEGVTTGTTAPQLRVQLSADVRRQLPALARLAARPDASNDLKALVAFLLRQES